MKIQTLSNTKCHHCGDELKSEIHKFKKDDTEYQFCCNGCLQAFIFINESGFGEYYNTREDYATKPDSNFIEDSLYEFIEKDLKLKSETSILEKNFYIKGIHCASCVWINEKVLSNLEGVIQANVSLSTNRVLLKWDSSKISLKEISRTVQKIGYKLFPINEKKENFVKIRSDTLLKKMAIAGFFMGNNMLISVALYAGFFDYMDSTTKQFFHWMSFFLTTPVFFYSASEFFKSAFYSLKNQYLSTDTLTSFGISLAYFYSFFITITNQVDKEVYFDAINFVVFVILIGRFIESKIKLKTWYYKTNLSSLTPEFVRVLINHHLGFKINQKTFLNLGIDFSNPKDFDFKKIEDVIENEIILVFPQEIVPLDGILINSQIEVDEASLTGEFKPILKQYGEFVSSGSKNVSNTPLFLEVKHTYKESTVSKILELAEQSLLRKSKFETISSKVSEIFIVFVLLLGISTFFYWYFYKNNLGGAILYTLSLLIVACPCALSLSIPTALIVGLQELFSKGCLVQDSQLLEVLAKAKAIAFDKTGTLTEGKLNIHRIISYVEISLLKRVIELIVEYQKQLRIQHPISEAFYKLDLEDPNKEIFVTKKDFSIDFYNPTFEAKYYEGQGFELKNQFYTIRLGSEKWFIENQYQWDLQKKEKGNIMVFLGYETNKEKYLLAYFLLKDHLKQNVENLIKDLNSKYETFLLTGDTKENAEWIQEKTKIKKIYFNLKPKEKAEIIQNYQNNKQRIVMIGDGINDTIALKQADAGISFINASNLALYSSDIFLLNNDISVVYFLLNFTKFIFKKIKQNLTMSLLYNLILLPLAFLGYLSPILGAVFMSLSSITVVLNSLTIKKFKNS
ncbi:MAG: heavy metal translocating P-type ATPase [Leptonema sp. (in: bacteria)]